MIQTKNGKRESSKRRLDRCAKNEVGLTLIEVAISIAILSVIVAGFLGALGTATKAQALANERATAEALAKAEMEYVQEQPWSTSGYALPSIPSEYSTKGYTIPAGIVVSALPSGDANIQKITVTVNHNGKAIITSGTSTLVDYKVQP